MENTAVICGVCGKGGKHPIYYNVVTGRHTCNPDEASTVEEAEAHRNRPKFLTELVKKWRDEANRVDEDNRWEYGEIFVERGHVKIDTLNECADELEKMLNDL